MRLVRLIFGVAALVSLFSTNLMPQAGIDSHKPVTTPQPLPITTQIKKTVVFITTTCLHRPSPEELAKMTPEIVQTLTPEERDEWNLELSGVLTPEQAAKMTPAETAKVRVDRYVGTGFLVSLPEERLGKDQAFQYLVTNRHVVQPGIEYDKPCNVLQYSLALNHKGASADAPVHIQVVAVPATLIWYYSSNPSVDLAVTPVHLLLSDWDIEMIPVALFATPDMINKNQIVEGDPVMFAGLFVQYAGVSRLEPVVRSGSIAMLPDDLIKTTLGIPGRIYLAEAHAFGGNSGSPMFVDIDKFKNTIGYDYRLLGVVTGEVFESNNFKLQVTTSYNGAVAANSDISMIVPADEVKAIIDSAPLQKIRDDDVAQSLAHPK